MTSPGQQAGQEAGTEQAGQTGQDGQPADAPLLPEHSREDTDVAWGDYRGGDDEDRDRLYRDRPPHWSDY